MTAPQPEYIALQTINVNGVPAYHAGDPMFAGAVDRIPGAEVGVTVAAVDSNEAQALLRSLAKVTGDSDIPALDQLRHARDQEGSGEPGSVGAYDPTRHTVADVNAYLAEQGDAEKARVIEAERRAQGRNGIVDGPHSKAAASRPMPDVAEA